MSCKAAQTSAVRSVEASSHHDHFNLAAGAPRALYRSQQHVRPVESRDDQADLVHRSLEELIQFANVPIKHRRDYAEPLRMQWVSDRAYLEHQKILMRFDPGSLPPETDCEKKVS